MKKIPENQKHANKSPYFILRCISFIVVTIYAGWLTWALKEPLYREITFGIYVIYSLFVIGELNIKPITATASFEVKK